MNTGKTLRVAGQTFVKNSLQKRGGPVRLDYTHMAQYGGPHYFDLIKSRGLHNDVRKAYDLLAKGKSELLKDNGIPMTGWREMPFRMKGEELSAIKKTAREFASKIDVFLSLGIGGSYLGIEAVAKACLGSLDLYNLAPELQRGGPQIFFMGNHMDPSEIATQLNFLQGKRVGMNVISKSGTTTETSIAFRIMRDAFEISYKDPSQFIIATTDKKIGALKELATEKKYPHQYTVPDDVGGRFSVTSHVGLFGIALAGIDISEFIEGAKDAEEHVRSAKFEENIAMLRAAFRFLASREDKKIEVVSVGLKSLDRITAWMQQLGPESEGKEGKGLWVSPEFYSEMAHANGQMIQQGERNMIETFILVNNLYRDVVIPSDPQDLDEMNYLAGKNLSFVNQQVLEGLRLAHYMGGVPSMSYILSQIDPYSLGQLMQYEMNAIALSGLMLGINPFNQPGVKLYKEIMFARCGKPGYEAKAEEFKREEAVLIKRMA